MDRQWKYQYRRLACFSLNANLVMTINISPMIQAATVADLRQTTGLGQRPNMTRMIHVRTYIGNATPV